MIVRGLLRALASTVALVALYYLLPLGHSTHCLAITMLVIGLVALIGLIAFRVHTIIVSPFPGLRAVEALATSIPLFLLLFASTYVVMGAIAANSFNQPVTRTTRCTSPSPCSPPSASATSPLKPKRRSCCSQAAAPEIPERLSSAMFSVNSPRVG
jgi:hypothetical protein